MAPSSFCVSAPGRGQPTADPGGGELMVVVGGSNPGGTARWYSPAGAGTRHLARGGGSNHLHLLPENGQGPSGKPSGPLVERGLRGRPPRLPGSQPAPRPPSGSHAPPAVRSSPPLLRWLGRDGGWAGWCPPAGIRERGWRRAWPWFLVLVSRPLFPSRPARPYGSVCNRGGGLGRTEAEDLQSWRVQSFGSRAPLELMLKQENSVARLLRY